MNEDVSSSSGLSDEQKRYLEYIKSLKLNKRPLEELLADGFIINKYENQSIRDHIMRIFVAIVFMGFGSLFAWMKFIYDPEVHKNVQVFINTDGIFLTVLMLIFGLVIPYLLVIDPYIRRHTCVIITHNDIPKLQAVRYLKPDELKKFDVLCDENKTLVASDIPNNETSKVDLIKNKEESML